MTRRERLMATLRGEPVDRPAVNLYDIGGVAVDPADPDPFNIYNDPSWQPLLQLAQECTDLIKMLAPPLRKSPRNPRDEFFQTEHFERDGSRYTRVTLRIGGRTMSSLSRRDKAVDTVWQVEHLLKDADDLRAYLQLPQEVFEYDLDDVSTLVEADRAVGERGIVMVDTSDPLCEAAALFGMEDFTVVAFTEPDLFESLVARLAAAHQRHTEQLARAFPGHLWRIYGPEYAIEPYLPVQLFRRYVVRYTGPMIEAIRRHGGYARLHCHGRVASVLPFFLEMGADATDPLEPPPQGNVDLAAVRRQYGRELVLFGNIEMSDIETMEEHRFEKLVADTLRDGTAGEGRGFVLLPTAGPFGRTISARTMKNYETMVRLATRG